MTGISEKCVKVIVRTSRKSRKIGQHRITKTTQNQLCPNQRSQMTKWDIKIWRFIANACFGLMYQLLIALRARARPRKSHKTMKSSERFAKGPTTNTRYLPSLPWDLRTCVWTWSLDTLDQDYGRVFRCQLELVALWHSVSWQETPPPYFIINLIRKLILEAVLVISFRDRYGFSIEVLLRSD